MMSLRTRLSLGIGIVLLVALAATDLTVRADLQSSLINRLQSTLATSSRAVVGLVSPKLLRPAPAGGGEIDNPPPQDADHDNGSAPDGLSFCDLVDLNLGSDTFVAVRNPNGTAVSGKTCAAIISGTAYRPQVPVHLSNLPAAGPGVTPGYFTTGSTTRGGPAFRVAAETVPLNNGKGVILTALSLASTDRTVDQLTSIELLVSGAALLIGIVLGWFLVHLDLRPLRDMERTADAIAEGELESRVPEPNPRTEVGHLATALNVMLSRIEQAFAERDATEAELRASEDRLRRFVADASHELRTPTAAVSAYAELFQSGAATSPGDVERAMAGIRTESERMGHLVEDLLLLARLDEGRPLEAKTVELVGLANEAIETARTVGPAWPLHLVASGPVEVTGDPLRLRQVLDNLLSNVRSHTPPGTEVDVRVSEEDGTAVLEVTDHGPGIAPEHARRVFDRFYRADPSRARTRGGAGLGLSIVSSIVAAHHGTVEVRSVVAQGTTFIVRLPAAPSSPDDSVADDEPEETPQAAPSGASTAGLARGEQAETQV